MKKLFTLCLAALVAFTFAACSDDDSGSASSNSIVGTWVFSEILENGGYMYERLVFSENGTFRTEWSILIRQPSRGIC